MRFPGLSVVRERGRFAGEVSGFRKLASKKGSPVGFAADTENEVSSGTVFGLVMVEGPLVLVDEKGGTKEKRVAATIMETPEGERVFAGRVAQTPVTISMEQMERTGSGLVGNVQAALASNAAKIKRRAKR